MSYRRAIPCALALAGSLTLPACDGDPDASAEASSSPSASAHASASPSADSTKLDCDGYSASGVFDYAGRIDNGKLSYPPHDATPESIAEGFKTSPMTRAIQGWNLDDPPPHTVIRGKRGQTKVANAYFRNPGGAVIAILGMTWSRDAGWRLEGTENCTYGPDEPRPKPSPLPRAQVVIDRTSFSPRVQPKALRLDCSGPMTGVTADVWKRSGLKPLRNPDAETDGLVAYVHRLARRNPGVRGWEGSRPPSIVLLFPREPAKSMRAVVRFVRPSGQAAVVYVVERNVRRGPWFVESYRACV